MPFTCKTGTLQLKDSRRPTFAFRIPPMFLHHRRNGLPVISQLGRVCSRPPFTLPPNLSSAPTKALRAGPSIVRQLRVLRTQTARDSQINSRVVLNWSTTAHRIRHISPCTATMSATQSQTRSHAGHSHHGHHHHHDNTYLVSKNKNDAGVRITRIGLYVNLGMAVGKGVGGYVFHSQGK